MKIGGTDINNIKVGSTPIKKIYRGTNLYWVSDANARAFISAVGITDPIHKSAINQFILDLKAINSTQSNFVNFTTPSISVIKAIYPFVGGTAETHKFNLIDPRDDDTAFRLDFNGTITHNNLGIKGDGLTGYFDTHLNPSTVLALDSAFLAHYAIGNPITSGRYSLSIRTGTDSRLFFSGYVGTKGVGHMWNSTAGQGYIESTESWASKGKLQHLNRYGGNYNIGSSGLISTENTNTGGTLPNGTIKGLALDNSGTLSLYDDRNYGLMIIGKGLSDDSMLALSIACDNYQKSLHRYPYKNIFQFDGDSMTYGLRAGCTSPYPDQLIAEFSSPMVNTFYNYGVSGQKLTDMITDANTQVDINYDATKDNNIVFIWGGVNDLGLELSTTAEEVYNRLKTYCQNRKSVGFKVYAMTMLPQSVSTYVSRVTYESDRQIFNNLVRTDLVSSGFVDGIIDIASDSRIGLSGCENDTTYFLADKIHMNNTGYGVVADIAYESIRGIFGL